MEFIFKNIKKIFKPFYTTSKVPCSDCCFFYDENGTEREYTFNDAMLLKHRVIKALYEKGFKTDNYRKCNYEINTNAHLGCTKSLLERSDMSIISETSITDILIKKTKE